MRVRDNSKTVRRESFKSKLTAGQDDQMPQLISQASSPNHNQEQDDAVNLKIPKVLVTQVESISEELTAAEDIESDDSIKTTEDASPQYTSPSEDSKVEYLKITQTEGKNHLRVSQSLELESLVNRALSTFTTSNPFNNLINGEPSS